MVNKTSKFIPNSFQYPNAYVDQFMAFLTPNENVVLTYAIRRIIGFQKTTDRISISQFTNGLVGEEGARLDYGTGLGNTAVRSALAALVKYRLMKIVAPADEKANLPPEFTLQWDSARVDMAGLKARRSERKAGDQERTVNMRLAPRSDGQTRSDGQRGSRSDGQTSPGLTDETHNIPVETQKKKSRKDVAASAAPPPDPLEPSTATAQYLFGRLNNHRKSKKGWGPIKAFATEEQKQETEKALDAIKAAGQLEEAIGKALVNERTSRQAMCSWVISWAGNIGKPPPSRNGSAPPARTIADVIHERQRSSNEPR